LTGSYRGESRGRGKDPPRGPEDCSNGMFPGPCSGRAAGQFPGNPGRGTFEAVWMTAGSPTGPSPDRIIRPPRTSRRTSRKKTLFLLVKNALSPYSRNLTGGLDFVEFQFSILTINGPRSCRATELLSYFVLYLGGIPHVLSY
jgi:hypothetical protein